MLDYLNEESVPELSDALGLFRDGLAKYRRRDFAGARTLFERVRELHHSDKAATVYIERCQELLRNPPPEDWNGVWTMDSK